MSIIIVLATTFLVHFIALFGIIDLDEGDIPWNLF